MVHIDELQSIPLFADLSGADQAAIAQHLSRRRYGAGSRVYAAGEPSETLYLIESGEVAVTNQLDHDIVTLANLHAGYFFGESSILDNHASHEANTHVVAEDTTLFILPKKSFSALKQNQPLIALAILSRVAAVLSDRLTEDSLRIGIISAVSKLVNTPKHLNNIEALAQEILRITLRAIPSHAGFLGVYTKFKGNTLQILASAGIAPKALPRELPVDTDPYLNKLYQKDGEIIKNSAAYEDAEKVFYAKQNLLARAIMIEENNVGVIALADKTRGDFTPQNSLILRIIAGQISFAMEEARIRREQRAREELKREYIGL